ncbi:MAG: DNA polymerase III subunit gamma/tau [Christensenellales bacterium]|jgi:DNA polymerase-3 subunit gamma/tau
MAYVSLYRRFRPDTFEKVVGQDHITKTLINQIKNDNIGHAYLFTGTRGTGKTTCAKIFAKAVNCLSPVNGSPCNKCKVCVELSKPNNIDIIEIDAASNNGVEEIRQIKENTQYRPTAGRYKVYIVDEVHMLTASAFNALLKTLEEPPEHIIFILATTEAQKLPATILSRCLRFDFRLVSTENIANLLMRIFDELKVKYQKKAVEQIALYGEGSVRDAISVADMCLSYCDKEITLEAVLEALGASDFEIINQLGQAILQGDTKQALTVLDKLFSQGRNTIHKDLCNYLRNLLAIKNIQGVKLSSVTDEEAVLLKEISKNYENYRISRAMEVISGIETALRFSTQPRILLEATVVKACELKLDTSSEAVATRIKELENKLEQLKTEGIKIEKKADKEPKEKKQKPQEPEEKPDINKILKGQAVRVEDKAIFEEASTEEEERALKIWDDVLKSLNNMGERRLFIAASDIQEGIYLQDKALVVRSQDDATVKLLNREHFHKTMNQAIKEVLGNEYSFICEKSIGETNGIKEGLNQLTQLFGDSLKIKK